MPIPVGYVITTNTAFAWAIWLNTIEVEDKSHEEDDESEELVGDLDKALDSEFESGSPIKNAILQKYVKEEFGCEKKVCLNTKTRWNSLLAILARFLEIKSAISKALIDIKEEQMMVNVEFETVTTIVKGLKPVKIGLEKLCSRNATLLTAEGVFSFVIGELNEQDSEFAKNMKYSLIQTINERRNVNRIKAIPEFWEKKRSSCSYWRYIAIAW
ncbi:uncharacterized protein TNCV_2704381 [Trichonephila clavipes]|nr:uncharacterized protein TNCV_2704381 [Trichonephila clavipes]